MSETQWLHAIARITPDVPDDLDDLLSPGTSATTPDFFPASLPPSPSLWERPDGGESHIGIRVTDAGTVPPDLALRLASAAVERQVVPIILSHVPDCGFDRFGFRVERIAGDTAEKRAACEEEIARFWDMAVVIDLGQVAALR